MNDKLQKIYVTNLERANLSEISAVLDAKLDATSSFGVADYIGLSLDDLNAKIERIKQAEKDLKSLKAETQSQIDIIKSGVSSWISECGVDKLDGDIVSSVKVTQPKASEDVKITDEEALINAGYFKTVLDKTAVKNAILEGDDIQGAEIEVTHKEPSITVYKKKNHV